MVSKREHDRLAAMLARLDSDAQKHEVAEYGYGGSLNSTFDLFTPEQLEAQSLPAGPVKAPSYSTILQPQEEATRSSSRSRR